MNMSTNIYQPVSALALLQRFAKDPATRREFLAECRERIRVLDPQLQAMTAVLDAAEIVVEAETARGSLSGLPVVVKDIFDTYDLPTAYGSKIYEGHRPASDSAVVTQLRRAGALVLGKTVTCEFAYMTPTLTRNPAAPDRTAGGSSAGSAAAVAAGYTPFAIGSQTGGSTIRPASYCGVAGYKPTFGLIPTVGMKCFSWSFDTVGLFAAGVGDVAYLAQSLSGLQLEIAALARRPVIGVPESYPWTQPTANANRALQRAVDAAEQAGAEIRSVRFPPWMSELIEVHHVIQSYESYRTLGFEYDGHRGQLSPMLCRFLEDASKVTIEEYLTACDLTEATKADLARWFEGVDVLLTPSAPDEAPLGFESTGDPAFNRNWTLLGAPCVSVPGLRGDGGAPMGVQVIGRRFDDAHVLRVAAFIESALTGVRVNRSKVDF
ncbi:MULTISPECIES: amidase [Burkholderiaceae]|uniref:amidase n=1 Tax=Paraburkholderia domus TaxID=2793075 RepID=UPI0019121F5F|nr:amidase [Burkholderia sp. R-69749]CAE6882647.1 Putative amidase AmiD [Paraburkholderia domus]